MTPRSRRWDVGTGRLRREDLVLLPTPDMHDVLEVNDAATLSLTTLNVSLHCHRFGAHLNLRASDGTRASGT